MGVSRDDEKWWRDDENILILNYGAVRLAVPRSRPLEGKAEGMGFLEIKDPSDSCALQVSCLNVPPLLPTAPSLEEMLREVTRDSYRKAVFGPIVKTKREQTEVAWLDGSYDEKDTERDEWRMARARVLLACNWVFCALLTFSYWEDDTSWVVPAWERVVETLHLGDGSLLSPDPESRRN